MSKAPAIECRKNGPYLVRNLEQLRDARGQPIAHEATTALCRCGGSKSKPFCDGTHKQIGFSGDRLADGSADKLEHYRGSRITIHDNRFICSHAGYCTDQLASVFKYGQEPWIDPDGAEVAAIIEAVRRCPSGALSYSLEGDEAKAPPRAPSITVTENGPYAVEGPVALAEAAHWAEGASRERYALCRCGGSKNKPFCDGTHWSIGFKG